MADFVKSGRYKIAVSGSGRIYVNEQGETFQGTLLEGSIGTRMVDTAEGIILWTSLVMAVVSLGLLIEGTINSNDTISEGWMYLLMAVSLSPTLACIALNVWAFHLLRGEIKAAQRLVEGVRSEVTMNEEQDQETTVAKGLKR